MHLGPCPTYKSVAVLHAKSIRPVEVADGVIGKMNYEQMRHEVYQEMRYQTICSTEEFADVEAYSP